MVVNIPGFITEKIIENNRNYQSATKTIENIGSYPYIVRMATSQGNPSLSGSILRYYVRSCKGPNDWSTCNCNYNCFCHVNESGHCYCLCP